MKLYLGVDGGGTKTKVVVINELGKELFVNESGPSSIDTVEIEETILNIEKALKPYPLDKPFAGAFIGLGGIVNEEDKSLVKDALKKLSFFDNKTSIYVESDVINALASGNNFKESIVLICGTGMACFGNNNGKTHKAGGWGKDSLDEGSAYYLGLMALIYTMKAYDKRIKKSPFLEDVYHSLKINDVSEFERIFKNYTRTEIASYAKYVTKHENDLYALEIMEKGTSELTLCVKAVYQEIKLKNPNIVLVGSLANNNTIYKKMLHEKIKAIDENFKIITPKKDPALAAAFLAKDGYKL